MNGNEKFPITATTQFRAKKINIATNNFIQDTRDALFDRAVHRLYADPGPVCSNRFADRLFNRMYWAIRGMQFKIFYKNEELDVDDVTDRWEVGVQPPSLSDLARRTRFQPKWIKYMYAKFKNECPTGRMKEAEFRKLLASIIAAEQATDQYISRLFLAFANEDKKTITFQNLMECLSLIHPETAESNAQWTIRLITGSEEDHFSFPDFLSFTQSVFALNEGKGGTQDNSRETVQQRANTVFTELDKDGDGYVTREDMIRFFRTFETPDTSTSTTLQIPTNHIKRPNSLQTYK